MSKLSPILALSLLLVSASACTEGDKFFVAQRLDRPGNFLGTAVDDANIATDGLAFSENGLSVDELRIEHAQRPSDKVNGVSGNPDAFVILFRAGNRIFAAQSDANSLTPAVELTAPDRDFSVPVSLADALLIPLRFNNYVNASGQSLVSVNDKNLHWLVVYSYQTFNNQPNSGVGPRRALASHVFRTPLKNTPLTTDPQFPLLGDFEFGWQVLGQQVPLPTTKAGEDVVGHAVVSDGLIGTAEFTSSASAHSPTSTAPVTGAPGQNSLRFGDDMSRLGLLVFQFDDNDAMAPDDDSRIALQFTSFNFNQLRFLAASEVQPPPGHFNPDNVGVFQGATAYDPAQVRVSNQHVFVILRDATRMANSRDIVSSENVLSVLTIADDLDGTCSVRLNIDADLSVNGSNRGFHGQGLNEMANFAQSGCIFGPDEGLEDETVIVFNVADSSTSNDLDTDTQVHAAVISSLKGAASEGQLTDDPRRLSVHNDTAGTPFTDPALNLNCQLSRDGDYVLIAYRQNEDSAQGQGLALNALIYKTDTAMSFPMRFSSELRVDDGPQDMSRVVTGPAVLPVQDFAFQSRVALRCGQQTDSAAVAVVYEQSDGNQDRVFVRPFEVQLTDPPAIQLADDLEIDSQNLVKSTFNATLNTDEFSFIEGSVQLSQFRLLDIGVDSQNKAGEFVLVYPKEVDDIDTDDGRGDIDILAQGISLDIATDQAQLTFRGRIDNTDEGNGLGQMRRTELIAVVPTPTRAAASGPMTSPDSITIFFTQPSSGNISGGFGMFARSLRLDQFRAATGMVFFENIVSPGIGSAPVRIDARQSSLTTLGLHSGDRLTRNSLVRHDAPAILQNGTRMLLLFLQDGHLFASESQDGVNFTKFGQLPDPNLVDNESFGTNIVDPADIFIAPLDNSQCGNTAGTVILYIKRDSANGDRRILLRRVLNPL